MNDNTAIFLLVFAKMFVAAGLFVATGYIVFVLGFSGWWFLMTIAAIFCLPSLERVEKKTKAPSGAIGDRS